MPGVSASNWYGGSANTTRSPVRVGWAMSVGRARPVRDVPRFGLREHAVDDLPALGSAVAGPVVLVDQREVGGLDLGHLGVDHVRGYLLDRAAHRRCRVSTGDVQIDLQRTTGPARLRAADRLTGRGAAIRGLVRRQQPELLQRFARIDREELRREAVVGRHERRRVEAHQPAGLAEHLVGLAIGRRG